VKPPHPRPAANAGCETLWSEDMHHGLVAENTPQIINPFRAAA
jgi:predicted nucleic acid-binding protein